MWQVSLSGASGGLVIRKFILHYQTQATSCNFGDQLHIQTRDRLIVRISQPKFLKLLHLAPDCAFQSTKVSCEQWQDIRSCGIKAVVLRL